MEKEKPQSLGTKLKYYTTLTLGLVSCLSCFVFMFMIPFFLEPSISTLVANFDPDPVVCRTIYTEHFIGTKNCSWSSCKHGCTTDLYECDRVYVDYMQMPYSQFDGTEYEDDETIWKVRGVPVFVNIKACGYPPRTNCTIFVDSFAPIGSYFACYYSRVDPSLVITDYSWSEAVQLLVMALLIPNLLTGISLGILSYWWYPGCQKRRCQYQLPTDQEAASSHQGENDDDDDIDDNDDNDDDDDVEEDDFNDDEDDEEEDKSYQSDEKYETCKTDTPTIVDKPVKIPFE